MSNAPFLPSLAPASRSRGSVEFRRLEAADLFELEPQASQATWLGNPTSALTLEEAEGHASGPNSWTAWKDGKPLACFGVLDVIEGRQGAGWALLGSGLGRAHVALTRFVRDVVLGESPLARIDTFCPCALDRHNSGSQLELVSYALQHPTPEVRWALAIGFMPLCVMRRYGAAGETIMQLEIVR